MLSLATQRAAREAAWLRDPLWTRARMVPAFDIDANWGPTPIDRISGLDLTTHTRVAPATWIDSDGTLRTATTNLLLRSEEFDNASWTKNNILAFGSGSIANAAVAPDGATTADKIVESTATAQHFVTQSYLGTNQVLTFSVYLKAAERSRATIQISNNATGAASCLLNLTAGTAGAPANGGDFTSTSATISPVGDGWYKCAITTTKGAVNSNAFPAVVIANDAGVLSYTGDGTSGIYIWGAQLEASPTVGQYIPTTSTQRSALRRQWDATNRRWGWLVEEARTNLLLRSEEFDNASWTKSRSSVTANATAAPNGTTTADQLIEDTTAVNSHLVRIDATVVANTIHSASVYAKAHTRSRLRVELSSATNTANTAFGVFDLSSGAVVSSGAGGAATLSFTRMEPLSDGWYRCIVVVTIDASSTAGRLWMALDNGSTSFYTGDGTSGLFIWGAQLEAGAFPTSYIPTTGTTATRDADVWNWLSIPSVRSLYAEFTSPASGARGVASLNDNSSSQRIAMNTSGTDPLLTVVDGGVTQANIDAGTITANTINRMAVRFGANDFAASINGGAEVIDTSGTLPVVNRLFIGRSQAGEYLNGGIGRLVGFTSPVPMLDAVSR